MNTLDKFISKVEKKEIIIIIDEATSSLSNPFLRSLPFITTTGVRTATFPYHIYRTMKNVFFENIEWTNLRELVKEPINCAMFTNQNLEKNWTCKPLLDKYSKNPFSIIIFIPDEKFQLNQGMRPLIEEDYVKSSNVFHYETLMNSLSREIHKIFNFTYPEIISPLLLESLSYIAFIDKEIPSDSVNLIKYFQKFHGYYLDLMIKKISYSKIFFSSLNVGQSLYWQLGGSKKLLHHLVLSQISHPIKLRSKMEKMEQIFHENRVNIINKVTHHPSLRKFFSRNWEE